MSMINKEVSDFSVQAYQNGEFKTVTKADILGKWSVFFFYPADFTFVCPTELEDLQNKYSDLPAIFIFSLYLVISGRVQNMPQSPTKCDAHLA